MKRLFPALSRPLLFALILMTAIPLAAPPRAPRLIPHAESADGLNYAVIISGGAVFYDGGLTPLFVLPQTYYAVLTGAAADGFYPCAYADLDGFIKTEDLQPVDYEPVTKFPVLTLSVNADIGVRLRERPDHTRPGALSDIPDGERGIFYYGTLAGSAQIPAAGAEWYYVRREENGLVLRGYIYGAFTADVAAVTPNDGARVPVPEPVKPDAEPENADAVLETIIIASLALPAVFIVFLLFKSKRSPDGRKRIPFYADDDEPP